MAPTTNPRRSMSSRASVSSASTMAKNITVTAMYQDVAIQLATSELIEKWDGADRISDIDQNQQRQQAA